MGAEDAAHPADHAGHVAMHEDHQRAVQDSFPSGNRPSAPAGACYCRRACRPRSRSSLVADHLGGNQGAEVADLDVRCSTSSMPRSRSRNSELTILTPCAMACCRQAGGKGGRQQPRVLLGHFALVAQAAGGGRAVVDLGQQQAQPVGHVQVTAEALQRLGVQRRHVDRLLDGAGGEDSRSTVRPPRWPRWSGPLRCWPPSAACKARWACRTAGCRCKARSRKRPGPRRPSCPLRSPSARACSS